MVALNNLNDLLVEQLQDLYFAEKQLAKTLPKMAKKANHDHLRQAFEEHTQETETHIQRLEEVFGMLGQRAKAKTCEAMKGIIEEGKGLMSEAGDDVMDAALITAAQRAEHYEMAGYGSVRTYAQMLGHRDVAQILQQTLNEEGETDKKLTKLAKTCANKEALQA